MFKESGCYYEYSIHSSTAYNRMSCFPFVEPHEPFIYGDGTVYYAQRYLIATYLKRENPNLKAIFIIRDPVERGKYSF